MKNLVFILCALISLMMVGCASQKPPSADQIASANYGTLNPNYQDQIKSHFSVVLKDPYSAQYSFLTPFKAYTQDGPWSSTGGAVVYGWAVPVIVNAKNSYGGYTGGQAYVFIFAANGMFYDATMNDKFGRVVPVK